MATRRQIIANRKNAQQSTGPTSPEGRAISSQNAFRTGIDAKSEVLSFESPSALEELTAEYNLRFAPANPEERCLVDTLIRSEWLRRRYASVETRVWQERLDLEESVGAIFSVGHQVFSRLQSRQDSAQCGFASALKQLLALRANRPPTPESPETARAVPVRQDADTESQATKPSESC